ncbi:hypothetical protein NEDG_00481 [Nematocida displodere]|uniref:Uncharacterized protein n=1 Tax=Nematocida displodere TaxID=1805483 RepID=A0A177EJY4_9MICR|nr:hypothetical protein NEDG_00481 [Nematocida displodere]
MDSERSDLQVLVSAYAHESNKTAFKKLKLLSRINNGGCRLSLSKIKDYLSGIEGACFLEGPMVKRLIKELANVDVSVGIEYDLVSSSEWDELLSCAWTEALSRMVEYSPGLTEESSSVDEETKYKLSILITGTLALMEYCTAHMSDALFVRLMEAFEETLLPCTGLLSVHFIIFSAFSSEEKFSNAFISFLGSGAFNGYDPRREKMFCYLCSFLASSKYLAPSTLAIFTTEVLPAVQERLLTQSDTFASVILQGLMYLSLELMGLYDTSVIDDVIMMVKDERVIKMVSLQIQTMYKSVHKTYTVHPFHGNISILFPFESSSIPFIQHSIPNYKHNDAPGLG